RCRTMPSWRRSGVDEIGPRMTHAGPGMGMKFLVRTHALPGSGLAIGLAAARLLAGLLRCGRGRGIDKRQSLRAPGSRADPSAGGRAVGGTFLTVLRRSGY